MVTGEIQALTGALKLALDTWGKKSPKYSGLYKALPRDVLEIAHKALEEMTVIKPGSWEIWWATQHMRFIGSFKQMHLMILHEIMYHFLSAFARGELTRGDNVVSKIGPIEPAAEKLKAKASTSGRHNLDRV